MNSCTHQLPSADANRRKSARLQVILSGDAVGYSRLMSLDDDGTLAALQAARAVFLDCVTPRGGRIVDTAGDSATEV